MDIVLKYVMMMIMMMIIKELVGKRHMIYKKAIKILKYFFLSKELKFYNE